MWRKGNPGTRWWTVNWCSHCGKPYGGSSKSLKRTIVCVPSCLTLCDPTDCSPPGSSVLGISQARMLDWVAIPFCRGSSWPRDRTHISCIASRFFTTESRGKPKGGQQEIKFKASKQREIRVSHQRMQANPETLTRWNTLMSKEKEKVHQKGSWKKRGRGPGKCRSGIFGIKPGAGGHPWWSSG